jgi:hypothetical protein
VEITTRVCAHSVLSAASSAASATISGQLGGLGAELVAQGFKFGLRAPGSGPLQGAGAMVAKLFNQIAAQNLADKAGGAKNDDLVRGVFHVETFWVSQIIKRCSKPLCALPQRAVRWGARQ